MKHYGIAECVDFARGLMPEEERILMGDHLEGGCPDCRQVAGFCERLTRICRNMALHPAPDSVVRRARAIFPIQWPDRPKRALHIPIDLIYDSLLVPAPAGLRSSWQIGWQALYRAGDCSLDLRIEPELRSSRAAVIGQISNHTQPETEMTNIPVCLRSGKLVVAETLSNRFGEFQMEYEQQRRLQLCIYMEGGARCIQVPLKRLAASRPDRVNVGTVPQKKKQPGGVKQ